MENKKQKTSLYEFALGLGLEKEDVANIIYKQLPKKARLKTSIGEIVLLLDEYRCSK